MRASTTPSLLVHLGHDVRLGAGWRETAGLPLFEPSGLTAALEVGWPEAAVLDERRSSGNPATRAEREADAAPAQSGRPTEVTAGALLDRVLAGRLQALGARFWRDAGRGAV